jgi:two-component system response regulator HydG
MTGSDQLTRVLLVDDEVEFLRAIEPGLARRGFHVTSAESGQAALQLLSSETFDVIVLDVKMPGLDGVDTFREIKRTAPTLPVILLTGHGNIEQAFETSREGVYEYLRKPCDVARLANVARLAVRKTRDSKATSATLPDEIRLLLVDNDSDFVDSIAPALERRGVIVSRARNGNEAVEQARQMAFAVALVDVRMPDIDGLTLLRRLRKIDPLLEAIILTGHPSVPDVRRGVREGAFDYLTKPQRVEDLLDRIRAAAQRHEQRKEERRQKEVEGILSNHPD